MAHPGPIARLIEQFQKLPGIGEKTATRLAYHVLKSAPVLAQGLAEAIRRVKEEVVLCRSCWNLTDADPCAICRDDRRDPLQICVVEEPPDLLAIERTGKFRGHFHVLHGALSPLDGIGPDDLHFGELLDRLEKLGKKCEVIVATNLNADGEATALYLARILKPIGYRVTRLAQGIPTGGDLEYVDPLSIAKSLENRREL
ncbi:MAG: recombination mediator RecR [Deltaproteobacteria bacterium]|nr:recombination mediator RecR [Deltaproteobacteria bacterium]